MKRMLYACDKNDEVEKFILDIPKKAHNFLANLWENELPDNTELNWEKFFIDKPQLLSQQENEIAVDRQSRNRQKNDADN